jgi:hypothetical protein
MVLALMAIALPVMASDVSFSGELTAGFLSDFSNSTTVPTAGNAKISLAAKVDKNNTINAEFSTDEALAPAWDSFYLVSDLGGAFNLSGVDPVLTVGYGDPVTAATLEVSGYGNETVVASDSGATTEIALATAIGKTANVLVALDPTILTDSATAAHLVVSADGTFGPVMAAVYYGVNGAAIGSGSIGGGAKYTTTMSGINLGADAQVAYDLGAKSVAYGAGLSAGMKMVSGAVGFNGDQAGTMGLSFDASLTPSDMYGVDVAGGFNLTSGAANMFDTLDASGYVMAGATKIRLGYLYEGNSASPMFGAYNAPSDGNGLYASFDLSF